MTVATKATKRPKEAVPTAPALGEISATDRNALIAAYRAGVITSWKRDAERGYRVSITGRTDDYVEVSKLMKYLATLGGGR
jgi:hypothetical protein